MKKYIVIILFIFLFTAQGIHSLSFQDLREVPLPCLNLSISQAFPYLNLRFDSLTLSELTTKSGNFQRDYGETPLFGSFTEWVFYSMFSQSTEEDTTSDEQVEDEETTSEDMNSEEVDSDEDEEISTEEGEDEGEGEEDEEKTDDEVSEKTEEEEDGEISPDGEDVKDEVDEEATVVARRELFTYLNVGKYGTLSTYELPEGIRTTLQFRADRRGYLGALQWYTKGRSFDNFNNYWLSLNESIEKTFNISAIERIKSKYRHYQLSKKKDIIEMEEGLVPDINLPSESKIEISGRKLVSVGYVRQSYSGYSYYGTGDGTSGDIDMEQELQIKVKGTVARKTTVHIDYDDTRENENKNKMSIVYSGDEDEFVQEAAFGDINLSLPSTEFVSFSSSRAVFGGRGNLKKGPFEFMAIASREKGKTEQESFTGASEFTTNRIYDYDYSKRKYYIVNAYGYREGDESYYFSSHDISTNESGQPYIDVFVYSGTTDDPDTYTVTAYKYIEESDGETQDENPLVESQPDFEKLIYSEDYTIDTDTGVIEFNNYIGENYIVAICYKISDEDSDNIVAEIGYDGENPDVDNLKLIKPDNYEFVETPDYFEFYEFVNVYSLGATNISQQDFLIKLMDYNGNEWYQEGEETYLEHYGLDDDGDNEIESEYINYTEGIIQLPDRIPFDYDGNGSVSGPDSYPPDTSESRLYFYVEYYAVSNIIILRPNIIPDSEEVRINGVLQQKDVDYYIDYDTGYIEFFTEEINEPNANVTITYEYQPFFAELSKTLAGGRVELLLGEESHIGSTFIGEWTSEPREGEIPALTNPPTKQNVLDADLHLEYKPEFMTGMVDKLPLVETEYPSKFTLEVEAARSFINPNIVGLAEVDNMEGIKIAPSFPMREEAWGPSSHPEVNPLGATYFENSRTLLDIGEYQELLDDIYGGNLYDIDDYTYCLILSNLPDDPNDDSNDIYSLADRWGGIARVISTTGMDYIDKRYEYLEMVVNLSEVNSGRIHIDLGEINEDTDEDGEQFRGPLGEPNPDADTEDADLDGILDTGEDIGWQFDNSSATPPGDDSEIIGADNNVLDTEDFDGDEQLDTENNYFGYSVDIGEVKSGNSEYLTTELESGWYMLRVPLNMDIENRDPTWDFGNPDATNIKTVRLWVEAEDDNSFPTNSSIVIASLAPVGNRWDTAEVEPEMGSNQAEIDIISTKTDSKYLPVKRTYTTEGYTEEEASLAFKYTLSDWDDGGYIPEDETSTPSFFYDGDSEELSLLDSGEYDFEKSNGGGDHSIPRYYGEGDGVLNTEDRNGNGILDEGEDVGWVYYGYPGDETGADNGKLDTEDDIKAYTEYKYSYQPEDFTDYRYMKLNLYRYARSFSSVDGDRFFIRFGADENNYYEYMKNINEIIDNPDPDAINPGWGLVEIDLFRFLDMQNHPKILEALSEGDVVQAGNYIIKGDPSLFNIYEITIGVKTQYPSNHSIPIQSEIWVNEIQLSDSDEKDGWAKRVELDMAFADFITFGGDYRKVDSDFSSIGSLTTSNQEKTTYSGNLSVELSKMMPVDWKASMPLSVTYSKSRSRKKDRYEPGGSIYSFGLIESSTKRLSLGFKKRWLPTVNFSYYSNDSFNRRYSRDMMSKSYALSGSYSFPEGLIIVPSSVTLSYKRSRSKTDYNDPTVVGTNSSTHSDNLSTSVRFEPFDKFEVRPSFSYSYTHDDIDEVEISYSENYGFYSSLSRITGLRPSFSYSSNYSETFDDEEEDYNISNSSSLVSSFQFDIGRILGSESGFSSLSISPSYTLSRYSYYYNVNSRPTFGYRFGYDPILHGKTEPHSARFGHNISLYTKFRPLEFMSNSEDRKHWDCVTTGFNFSYGLNTQYQTGTKSKTKTVTFPDVDVRIDGVSNFPIAAKWLKRSSLIVDYSRKITDSIGYYRNIKHSPGLSWRATWSDSLKTTFDFDYTYQKDIDYSFQEMEYEIEPKVTKTISPSITVNYDMKLSEGTTIPLLSKIFRFRNEMDLSSTLTYYRIRYSESYNDEDMNKWTFNLSVGYYVTSNLHITISSNYSKYNYINQNTLNNSSLSIYSTFEALF